ncbi:hypothetical protein BDU57DRAFT_541654 [Ampelomyces quisqualis]|uniref:Uncharacterized protein n=1 Tax=Ampelomyces quisqualis TaxID=50730 RepID=A0A6A5QFT3_AMPQU|nr:hypothetical protein BDU57DRAFT_541654 [Ampelomyces quisqualis]
MEGKYNMDVNSMHHHLQSEDVVVPESISSRAKPPKRPEEVNKAPKHAEVPDEDILYTNGNSYNIDAIYSESIEDNYVFYDQELPACIIREGEYLGYAGGSHVYHRNERTCVRMLVAEQQRLKSGYDEGADVSAGLPSNSTRAAHNDREDLMRKLEYSPNDKGLDFDQMREEWQNDEKLYVFGWE